MQVTHDCHVISCSTLSSCCHALLALLYPFEWQVSLLRYVTLYFIYSSLSLSQHTLIPVLPDELIDFCGSPLPCVFGISPSMIKKLDHLEIEMEEVNLKKYMHVMLCDSMVIKKFNCLELAQKIHASRN